MLKKNRLKIFLMMNKQLEKCLDLDYFYAGHAF